MTPAEKYAHEDTEADLKGADAEAGRKLVKRLYQYPILSPEWISLVDVLTRLTHLVRLEGRLPPNTKVAESQGRNADSEGTLWDQEQNENAVRILVEEAKVNLCLRMMNDYKRWCYDPQQLEASLQAARQALRYSEGQLHALLAGFEESLGLLLRRAFVHVETLQLMDVPLLVDHCALVLEHCLRERRQQGQSGAEAKAFPPKSQETVVLCYFASLMKHAEALNSSELLAKAREHRLLHLVAGRVAAQSDFSPEVASSLAEGLAALADNEDFRTGWEDFFVGADGEPDTEAKTLFLELEETVVKSVLEASPECRRGLRPLLDFFARVRRSVR